MPLLTPPPTPPIEQLVNMQVSQIRQLPRRLAEQLYRSWDQAFDFMWVERDGVTPAMRLEALGTAAAEMFERNTALVTFMVGMFTGEDNALVAKIMAKVATIPAYTVNEDGTVTLNP